MKNFSLISIIIVYIYHPSLISKTIHSHVSEVFRNFILRFQTMELENIIAVNELQFSDSLTHSTNGRGAEFVGFGTT
jgi:hypothetical protein